MELTFLLETSTLIEVLRGKNRSLLEPLRQHSAQLATSSICAAELHYGAMRSSSAAQELAKVAAVLAKLPVLAYDDAAAEATGQIRAALAHRGTPIGAYDTQIAGHCAAAELTLVTNNVKHFSLVEGLPIENWTQSRG